MGCQDGAMERMGVTPRVGDRYTPSPLYFGERAGVRGWLRACDSTFEVRRSAFGVRLFPLRKANAERRTPNAELRTEDPLTLVRSLAGVESARLVRLFCWVTLLASLAGLAGGCTSAVESGHNTALDSV